MAKKKEVEKVKCLDCKRSELMQWDNNPIIAKCPHRLYRQVANSLRECGLYSKSYTKKDIKMFTHLIK